MSPEVLGVLARCRARERGDGVHDTAPRLWEPVEPTPRGVVAGEAVELTTIVGEPEGHGVRLIPTDDQHRQVVADPQLQQPTVGLRELVDCRRRVAGAPRPRTGEKFVQLRRHDPRGLGVQRDRAQIVAVVPAAVDEAISASGATSPADMGKVMGRLMSEHQGKIDGKTANALVRERLAAG